MGAGSGRALGDMVWHLVLTLRPCCRVHSLLFKSKIEAIITPLTQMRKVRSKLKGSP